MRAVWKREMQGYFFTPLGYLYLGGFVLGASFVFFAGNLYPRSSDMSGYYAAMSTLWLFLTPLLVMRQIAGERRQMTDQLLLTAPIRIRALVAGKFLAAVSVFAIAALLSLLHVLIVACWGRVYPGEFLTILLGFLLEGIALIALDFLVASLCRAPATAFLLALWANLLVWLSDTLSDAVSWPALQAMLRQISLYQRFQPFLAGQLSPAGVVFFLCFTVLCLALSIRLIDARRWSVHA